MHVNIPSLGEIQDNQIGSQLKAQNHEIKFDLKLITTQLLQAGGTKLSTEQLYENACINNHKIIRR